MWNLIASDDERMIAEAVREFLAAEQPLERLRPGGRSRDASAELGKLGWFGVGLPEAVGGAGMGIVAEALVQRECGRVLLSPTVLATVLAGHVAWQAGDAEFAGEIAAGRLQVALAIEAEPARAGDDRSILAFDAAAGATLLFWNDAGMGIFGAHGWEAGQSERCFDESLALRPGRLALDRPLLWVPVEVAPLAARAQLLLAAALVGLAEQACALAVDYAKVREQFGKPIGSFQAVKHRCADMAVRQRLAWYQTSLACLKLEAGAGDAGLQIASAKLLAVEAAHENGRACVQIHGGIGFQAECDAHWFLKRARVYDQAGGDMQQQLAIIASAPQPNW
jgi:alkylation response protein AidB-like acyl-CoA dehydrogenase